MLRALPLMVGLIGITAGGGVTAQIAQVQRAVQHHAWTEALDQTRALEASLAAKAPLEVSDPEVLGAPAEGLGMYTPLPGGMVHGDTLYLYARVRNHGLRHVAGWYELDLVSDLIVLDAHGHELARDMGFGESRFSARVPHRDTFVNIALKIKGLATGSYRLRLIIHDRIGHKTGSAEVPFRVP